MSTRIDPPRVASSSQGSHATPSPHSPPPHRSPAFDGEHGALRKAAILVVSLDPPLASQLLANLDRADVEAVTLEIARLEGVDPEEQHAVLEEFYGLGVRRLRFVFEDLVRMDDREIREAYHDEDAPTWALALAGASRTVRARILGALSSSLSEGLSRRLDQLGPFRLDECEAAQTELAEHFRRLHDLGQITLPDPNGQEVLLV